MVAFLIMTLRAVAQPLERGVRFGERPRGKELGVRPPTEESKRDEDEPESTERAVVAGGDPRGAGALGPGRRRVHAERRARVRTRSI